jgi:hypothetical protein
MFLNGLFARRKAERDLERRLDVLRGELRTAREAHDTSWLRTASQPAALDILARFAPATREYFAAAMEAEEMGTQARYLHALAQSPALREAVLGALRDDRGRSAAIALRLACVTGMLVGDWPAAWRMVAEAEARHGSSPAWNTRVEALRRMQALSKTWRDAPPQELAALGQGITDLLNDVKVPV